VPFTSSVVNVWFTLVRVMRDNGKVAPLMDHVICCDSAAYTLASRTSGELKFTFLRLDVIAI